jgi:hypothetical protein
VTSDQLSILLTIGGAIVGALISHWYFRRGKESDVTVAAAQISGLAHTIVETSRMVNAVATRVDEVHSMLPQLANSNEPAETSDWPIREMLSMNNQLMLRTHSNPLQKRAIGKYARRILSPGQNIVVDCGTTTAWAFWEMVRDGPPLGTIFTNNIFVALIMSDTDTPERYRPSMVEELASNCQVLGGCYFPSYGGIFHMPEDSEDFYTSYFSQQDISIIMMGATSFRAEDGPYARSGANRRFKAALLRYTLDHENCRLIIAVEADKVGVERGEPCDNGAWKGLRQTSRVEVLFAVPTQPLNADWWADIVHRTSEEIDLVRRRNYLFILKALDESGRPVNIRNLRH